MVTGYWTFILIKSNPHEIFRKPDFAKLNPHEFFEKTTFAKLNLHKNLSD